MSSVYLVRIGYTEFVAPRQILDILDQLRPINDFWDNEAKVSRTYFTDSEVSVRITDGSRILDSKPEPKLEPTVVVDELAVFPPPGSTPE